MASATPVGWILVAKAYIMPSFEAPERLILRVGRKSGTSEYWASAMYEHPDGSGVNLGTFLPLQPGSQRWDGSAVLYFRGADGRIAEVDLTEASRAATLSIDGVEVARMVGIGPSYVVCNPD